MTEETVVVTAAEPEVVVEQTPVRSAHEEQAIDSGWVPKDEWVAQGKDADEWRTAKEFNDRGQLYKTIHQTNRELKNTQAQLGALRKHNEYIFEKAYQKAYNELKLGKRAAMREQDFDAVDAIENEMSQLQQTHQQEIQAVRSVPQIQAPSGTPPELQAWMDSNKWYTKDEELRDHADATGLIFFKKNPHATPQEVLAHISRDTKRKFPEKFGEKRAAPNAVAGVDRTTRAGPSSDIELDDFETEIMNQLVKSGEMTKKEYKDQLKKAKGIK